MQCSDLDAKLGSIQVAELTITSVNAIPGQEVRISNDAYTIIANFNVALTVTVPIYCWGDYTISSNAESAELSITSSKFTYNVDISRLMLYSYGTDYTEITGGIKAALYGGSANYTFTKGEDSIYMAIGKMSRGLSMVTSSSINLTGWNKLIFSIRNGGGPANCWFGLCSNPGTGYASRTTHVTGAPFNTESIVEVDISKFNSGHVFSGINADTGGFSITVYEIYLTR